MGFTGIKRLLRGGCAGLNDRSRGVCVLRWPSLCHAAVVLTLSACGSDEGSLQSSDAFCAQNGPATAWQEITLAPLTGTTWTDEPSTIAVSNHQVVWAANGVVRSVPTRGGDATEVVRDDRMPRQLVADRGALYLVVEPGAQPGGILRLALDGNDAIEVASGWVRYAAIDRDGVFFTQWDNETPASDVIAVAHDSANSTLLLQQMGYAQDIVSDESNLYVAHDEGAIYRIAKQGGDAVRVVNKYVQSGTLRLVDGRLWFVSMTDSGALAHAPTAGGDVTIAGRGLQYSAVASACGSVFSVRMGYRDGDDAPTYSIVQIVDGAERELHVSTVPIRQFTADETGFYWTEWNSECLSAQPGHKGQTCAEYRHEGRVAGLVP